MFDKETRYLPFLGMGEKLKGGKEFIYQSFKIMDIVPGEKLNMDRGNPVYGPEINGFKSYASFVKNKYNIEGVRFPLIFDMKKGYLPELSDMEYLVEKKFGFSGGNKIVLDVLPEVQFTRRTLLETIEQFPQVARAIAFTAKYHATQDMFYGNKMPMPLTDWGLNLPLEQRLAMIYSFTDSYNPRNDFSEAYTNFAELAEANKHYFCLNLRPDLNIHYNNNIIKDTDISVMNDGYSLIQGPGVSPFDVKTENTFDSKFVFENGISA